MILNITDRLVLGSILPSEGNLTMMRSTRELKKLIEFTQSEIDEVQLEFTETQVKWNKDKFIEIDVKLEPDMFKFIEQRFSFLSSSSKLSLSQLETYEKFLEVIKV